MLTVYCPDLNVDSNYPTYTNESGLLQILHMTIRDMEKHFLSWVNVPSSIYKFMMLC